jgi:hypothetical protein
VPSDQCGSDGLGDGVDVAIKLGAIWIMARIDFGENDSGEVGNGAQDSECLAGSAEVDPGPLMREVAQWRGHVSLRAVLMFDREHRSTDVPAILHTEAGRDQSFDKAPTSQHPGARS